MKKYLTKHIVVKPIINSAKKLEPFEESYRNLLAQYYPEDRSSGPQARHFQLTAPRLSECREFFEENVALLENPETVLGVARTPLSPTDKLWLTRTTNGVRPLLESILVNKKKVPEFFLFE